MYFIGWANDIVNLLKDIPIEYVRRGVGTSVAECAVA